MANTDKTTFAFQTTAAKKPEDFKKKMNEIFEANTTEGVIRLKRINIPMEVAMDEGLTEQRAMQFMVETFIVDEESRENFWKLGQQEAEELQKYWQSISGIDLGESSASSK